MYAEKFLTSSNFKNLLIGLGTFQPIYTSESYNVCVHVYLIYKEKISIWIPGIKKKKKKNSLEAMKILKF